MKRTAGLAILLLLGVAAFAQRITPRSGGNVRGFNGGFGSVAFPGGGQRPVSNFNTGYGNVAHPAFGHAPAVPNFSITDPSFASRLGRTVNGTGVGGYGYRGRGANYVYVPYAYPVYVDPSYYNGYAPDAAPAQQQPNVTVIYPPQANPVTIINQTPGTETPAQALTPRETAPAQEPAPQAQESANQDSVPASYYLIAFKDHSIYSAVAYWVEGDTLHYFTSGNVHNQASMSLVDKDLTERLNKERSIDVSLPQ
jgi:hypothetical protein